MADYDLKGMQAVSKYQLGITIDTVFLDDDWVKFRSEAREICDHFLTLATASLLADMKIPFFFQNLCRSAENWRYFLVSARDHYHQQITLNYNAPLYAAIIADNTRIIQGIVDALPVSFLKGEEYEDRFITCKLHALLAISRCTLNDEIKSLLGVLVNAEKESFNSILFKALLGLDELGEAEFWEQFETALYAYEELVESKKAAITVKISEFIAHRYIWFEGLAWLRLALIKGFTLPSGAIAFCPDEALEKIPGPYQGEWILIPLPDTAG